MKNTSAASIFLTLAVTLALANPVLARASADATSSSSAVVSSIAASPKAEYSRAPKFDLYSETTYLQVQDNYVNQTKLTYRLLELPQFQVYLGAAIDQDSRSDEKVIYNDNHVAPLAGARYSFSFMDSSAGVFAEYRHALRLYYKPEQRMVQEPYVKTGAFIYSFSDHSKLLRTTKVIPFSEGYAEAVFTSKVDPGVSGSGWLKLGTRIPLNPTFSADGYLEGIKKLSTYDYAAENLQEAGPAARLNAKFGRVSASVSARRGFGRTSISPQYNYSHWTGLLVIAGEI